ncbi:bridge-like lipid transfer protein family member 3B isoform X2 [Culicoides brevitarsis]|uniref:bridge-like lipid transfer protein family member 3B isoform X2 n=1 Tax=Culicoides brevitarsis TaxID=469753 RepID=UPI00307C18AA
MVSIIKNQLLKHLSRYCKNLSADKINLNTLRGEGELSNLQLDEEVLTDLLELPTWLRLTNAWCNHVAIRISWTKLKSVPITLTLDEVNISVETCEVMRTGTTPTGNNSLSAPMGKYSFIHKVIDGITIVVNTVNIRFKSPAFTASVQMSRIRVESRTPKWQAGDLHFTRLKDPSKGHLLIFKEMLWQTVRIEASSTQDSSLTPLRLLTNQARCRITIKKKMSDCSVISSRLVIILDDLLWVLTDSQLKAALHFIDSLSGLIQSATKETQKLKAQRKLETLPEYQAQMAQSTRSDPSQQNQSVLQKSFNAFDVRETSYHFFSQRIDLHLCDDPGDGRSSYPSLKDGGALQISVTGFQVDFYPYHLAKTSRAHWPKYREANVPPAMWLEQSLNAFREALLTLGQPNRTTHAPLERAQNPNPFVSQPTTPQTPTSGAGTPQGSAVSSPIKRNILDNLAKLMSACVILRVEDFTLYRVTTSGKKQMPKEFISGDKDRYSFPPDMSTIHAEFTYFYYPGDFVFPLPPSKAYVHVNPIQINFDLDSCLWLNSFALNLHESLLRTKMADNMNSPSSGNEPSLMYMDVKLEAIMPRVVIEARADTPNQRDRPRTMQIQVSRFAITNIREMGASRADLAQALSSLQEGSLVFGSGFPSKHGDMCIVTDRILSHVAATDMTTNAGESPPASASSSAASQLTRYALWAEPRDVWCVKLDPVWVDFLGVRSIGVNRATPFIDAVPITLWIHGKSTEPFPDKIFEHKSDFLFDNPPPQPPKRDGLILSVAGLQQNSNENDVAKKNLANKPVILNGNEQKTKEKTEKDQNMADLHVIAHVSNLVSIQVDHYQLLFLLRFAEEITELTTFLSVDAKRIMKDKNTDNSIIIGCVIPQVEVSLIMPSMSPGKESSGGDAESVLPDSASLGDELSNWPQQQSSLDLVKNSNIFNSIDTPSPVTDAPVQSIPNAHGHNVQIQTPSSKPTPDSSQKTTPKLEKSNRIMTALQGGQKAGAQQIGKELNSSIISMKKGFSNFMTSIDSALKTSTDDISDTISIHSDYSSDSENFIMIMGDEKTTDCMDVMFKLNPFGTDAKIAPVEQATECIEEEDSSPSEPSEASSLRRRDLVSMATFRLTTVELIRQNKGSSSSMRVQVSTLTCDECGAIPWDEFQTKFGARCRAWNIAPHNPEAPPSIALRLEEDIHTPENVSSLTLDRKTILSWFQRKVNIRVKDLSLTMSMSTATGLSDLAEDEVLPTPLPMEIDLENVKIHLNEDRPPVNITSPGPVPIDLSIGKMRITRDAAGIFYIQPKIVTENHVGAYVPEKDKELLALHVVMQQLKIDNDSLRKQMATIERRFDRERNIAKEETDVLKTCLKIAQDDIASLLEEKSSLMDTIKALQSQLTATEIHLHKDGRR